MKPDATTPGIRLAMVSGRSTCNECYFIVVEKGGIENMKMPATLISIVFAGVTLTVPVYGTALAADRARSNDNPARYSDRDRLKESRERFSLSVPVSMVLVGGHGSGPYCDVIDHGGEYVHRGVEQRRPDADRARHKPGERLQHDQEGCDQNRSPRSRFLRLGLFCERYRRAGSFYCDRFVRHSQNTTDFQEH